MLRDISPQSIFMGLLAGFVGSASSFAVVLQGLTAVGATPEQAASGLMALSLSMGLCAIVLSLKTKLPISIAWSTPGAALLATSGAIDGGFAVAVGAFIICAILIIISGVWKPLGRAVAGIPTPLANAMLAGVLLGLCLDWRDDFRDRFSAKCLGEPWQLNRPTSGSHHAGLYPCRAGWHCLATFHCHHGIAKHSRHGGSARQ